MKRIFLLFSALACAATAVCAAPPPSPLQVKYDALKKELLECEDAQFEAKRAEMLDFLANPGETNALQLVNFWLDVARRDSQGVFEPPDYLALAFKASEGSPEARAKFYTEKLRLQRIAMAGGERGGSLDPGMSHEARLATAEQAMADPLVPHLRGFARGEKVEALRLLGRDADLLKYLDGELAACKEDAERSVIYALRAGYYLESAKRFFDKPEPSVLSKAREDFARIVGAPELFRDKREYGRTLVKLADVDLKLGDYAAARADLAKYLDNPPDGGKVVPEAEIKLGEVAYAEGRYDEAADLWLKHAAALRDVGQIEKLARALFATGRKAEALPHLETLAKRGDKYAKLYYKYALEELKRELEDGKAE